MATVPTQVRIDENLKNRRVNFCTVGNGYVRGNEYFFKTVCIKRWTTV